MILYISLSLLALLFIVGIVLYNQLIKARNLVDTAFADIDVHLLKRAQLVPTLLQITKSYATYENELLLEIVEKRSGSHDPASMVKADTTVSSALKEIKVIYENYPELKANQQFLELMEQLGEIEDHLLFARRFYNGTTRKYNTLTQAFPSSIIASIGGFKAKTFYAVSDDGQREVPLTSFN